MQLQPVETGQRLRIRRCCKKETYCVFHAHDTESLAFCQGSDDARSRQPCGSHSVCASWVQRCVMIDRDLRRRNRLHWRIFCQTSLQIVGNGELRRARCCGSRRGVVIIVDVVHRGGASCAAAQCRDRIYLRGGRGAGHARHGEAGRVVDHRAAFRCHARKLQEKAVCRIACETGGDGCCDTVACAKELAVGEGCEW